jgi:soluble lytic murein transglycosylase-like protein
MTEFVIDPILYFAFMEVESSFEAKAFLMDSNGGSYGLTQLDFPTARDRGYTGTTTGLYDPGTNLLYFTKVIEWISADLTKHGKYSQDNVAAAYNSGLGHVLGGGTDEIYVKRINTAYQKWKQILTKE